MMFICSIGEMNAFKIRNVRGIGSAYLFSIFFYVNSISSRYAYDGVFIVALVKKGKAEGSPSCLHDDRVRHAIPKPLLHI
jgi:hypothetical protein